MAGSIGYRHMMNEVPHVPVRTVMIVDDDVLVRLAISDYLRDCGYRVIEVESTDSAMIVLQHPAWPVDVVLMAVSVSGSLDGFGLSRWIRERCPEVSVMLAGTADRAADLAGGLCESGPTLARPYDTRAIGERIRQLRRSPAVDVVPTSRAS